MTLNTRQFHASMLLSISQDAHLSETLYAVFDQFPLVRMFPYIDYEKSMAS